MTTFTNTNQDINQEERYQELLLSEKCERVNETLKYLRNGVIAGLAMATLVNVVWLTVVKIKKRREA